MFSKSFYPSAFNKVQVQTKNINAMKTLKITLMMLLFAATSHAQIPMNMNEKIKDEQVPVAVLKTFESEFGSVKSDIKDGAWYAHFEHTANATPTNPGQVQGYPASLQLQGET
jgi:hypothetical protein